MSWGLCPQWMVVVYRNHFRSRCRSSSKGRSWKVRAARRRRGGDFNGRLEAKPLKGQFDSVTDRVSGAVSIKGCSLLMYIVKGLVSMPHLVAFANKTDTGEAVKFVKCPT